MDSSLRDNFSRGNIGAYLKEKIKPGSELSVVSAFFTIYAYHSLRDSLGVIKNLRFLYGDPSFTKSLDPSKASMKAFRIEDENIELVNTLEQSRIAKECASWIEDKVEIRSVNKV